MTTRSIQETVNLFEKVVVFKNQNKKREKVQDAITGLYEYAEIPC